MNEERKSGVRWYEIAYVLALVGLLVYTMFFANKHRVGVLDLARLAQGVGIDARINEDNRHLQDQAETQLKDIQERAAKVTEKMNRQIEGATGAKKEEAKATLQEAQKQLQEEVNVMGGTVQRHRAAVIATFRKRIQPAIDAIARKRRLDLVIEPSASVLYVTQTVDITDDVVKECKPIFDANPPLMESEAMSSGGLGMRPAPVRMPGGLKKP